MAIYRESIHISSETAERIRHYMDDDPRNQDESLFCDSIIIDVPFPSGYCFRIACWGITKFDWSPGANNKAWGELTLLDTRGFELNRDTTNKSSVLLCDPSIYDRENNKYIAHLIIDEEA